MLSTSTHTLQHMATPVQPAMPVAAPSHNPADPLGSTCGFFAISAMLPTAPSTDGMPQHQQCSPHSPTAGTLPESNMLRTTVAFATSPPRTSSTTGPQPQAGSLSEMTVHQHSCRPHHEVPQFAQKDPSRGFAEQESVRPAQRHKGSLSAKNTNSR